MASQILDDTNPTLIYSSGWQTLANPNAINSTLSFCTTAGSKVRINFQVQVGYATLSIFGVVGPTSSGIDPPHSAYSLDGRKFEYFNASETNSFQYNQRFYLSPSLANGSHSLTVTNLQSSSVLYLDYFLIVPVNTGLSSSTSSQMHSGATIASTTPSSTPAASSVGTMNDSTSRRTTAIVASVLGTIIVVLVLFGIIWLRRRKKRKSKECGISSFVDGHMLSSFGKSQVLHNEAPHGLLRYSSASESACSSSNQASHSNFQDAYTPVTPSTSEQPHRLPYNFPHQLAQVEDGYSSSSPPDYSCDPPTYIPGLPSPASQPSGRLLPSKLRNELNQGYDSSTGGSSGDPLRHIS